MDALDCLKEISFFFKYGVQLVKVRDDDAAAVTYCIMLQGT